ncbi:MAG TPA: sigma 54-interacting transcriptional regulator [Thermoanaerobaculia bacterium]
MTPARSDPRPPTGTTPTTFTRRQVSGVLDGLEDAAVLVGTDRRILAANRAYLAHFGLADDPAGRHCYEVSHRYSRPCDEMGETCCLRDCMASGELCRTLHVHHTREGPEHEEVTTYPVLDDAGRLSSFLEVIVTSKVAAFEAGREHLVGRSPAFNRMLEMVRRVAPSHTTVLLLGESGTGKELVALQLHRLSPRADRPFVPVECSGISESLFESELFGHERGAFTGAVQRKMGLVEAAEGGTLFLDEVGDIPLSQQVKLLRLIETGVYRRVGSVEQRRAHFRLVCATHRDLEEHVRKGTFRADLYYRISAFPLVLPPLRERPGDVPVLVEHLLERLGHGRLGLHPETMAALEAHPFPGNVRELLNALERACLLADGDVLRPRHLPPQIVARDAPPGGEVESLCDGRDVLPLEEVERRYLRAAVERFPGTKRELAAKLGIGERTLYRKLSEG